MLIRQALPEDLAPAADALVDAYLADGFVGQAEEGYVEKLADTASRAAEAELYVALLDEQVVGCVTYCPNGSPWGEIAESGEGEFRMLGVTTVGRGRGIGLVLTQRCLDRSRELDYHAVVLSSLPTMTSAHRLYERLGFRRRSHRDWSPAVGVRLWAFQLSL